MYSFHLLASSESMSQTLEFSLRQALVHVFRKRADETYERTNNPQYNRFEQMRVRRASYLKSLNHCIEGNACLAHIIHTFNGEIVCATEERDQAQEALRKA